MPAGRNAKNSARAAMRQATRNGRRPFVRDTDDRDNVTKRDPTLWEAMERFQRGDMSAADFEAFVKAYKGV